MAKLNEMIKDFRLSINQSIEAIALLMQMSPEEYERLEGDWLPPDDLLQRLCSLFEWNYNDVKQIASNTPVRSSVIAPRQKQVSGGGAEDRTNLPSFHEQLRNARLQVNQSPEGIATLLDMSPDYYLMFEEDTVPTDDVLRKICSLFQWNYLRVRQRLITHSSRNIASAPPPLPLSIIREQHPEQEKNPSSFTATERVFLGERMRKMRIEAGQSLEGIALLLKVSAGYYSQVESGEITPDIELLKGISSLFQWNYNQLLREVQNENIRDFQPAVTSLQDFGKSSKQHKEFKELQKEISKHWFNLSRSQQESLIAQMELIRDTVDRWMLQSKR